MFRIFVQAVHNCDFLFALCIRNSMSACGNYRGPITKAAEQRVCHDTIENHEKILTSFLFLSLSLSGKLVEPMIMSVPMVLLSTHE